VTSRARRRASVTATRNLEINLERIEAFLSSIGEPRRYEELLEHLAERIVPLLERAPGVGTRLSLSAAADDSRDVLSRVLVLLKGDDLRKLVLGDFVLLYLVTGRSVHLLAIRHHRERGFRFTHGT
jgi:hypothetical protein